MRPLQTSRASCMKRDAPKCPSCGTQMRRQQLAPHHIEVKLAAERGQVALMRAYGPRWVCKGCGAQRRIEESA